MSDQLEIFVAINKAQGETLEKLTFCYLSLYPHLASSMLLFLVHKLPQMLNILLTG